VTIKAEESQMVFAAPLDLATFNDLPTEGAERIMLGCCQSAPWAGRPYPSPSALYKAADAALAALDETDLDGAIAAHPRIGERVTGAHAQASRREQAAVASAEARTVAALAKGNREYEVRFGHVYLVCAEGRSGEELLTTLRRRLHNDPWAERAQARIELGKINRSRLARLIVDDDGNRG